jgi:2'-5' RNA ligase
MNATEIVKHILEAEPEEVDPLEFVKSASNRESATEIYNGPLVRVIQPLSVFTVNNYLQYDQSEWDDSFFKAIIQDGPLYLAVDKTDHDNFVMFQPNTNKAWNSEGREQEWKAIPSLISSAKPTSNWGRSENPQEDKNWLDLQQGLATYFMAQIAKKKNVGQWVKYLTMIGRTDLATNYARYLGRAKLPFGKSIDAVMAMKKAGKRSRNRIARLMKNQDNVKWGEQGFWLLFNDWEDLAPFYGESSNYDYAANAEKIFSGDTTEWFDNADNKPEDVWGEISDKNMSIIKQLLVNRTVYNSDGEEHLVTRDNVEELTDDEIKDIVCDRGNKGDSTDDIHSAIRWAADDAYRSQQEGAYFQGYKDALMKEWGLQEDKTIKWISVGKRTPDKKNSDGTVERGSQKTMLGLYFPYSTLEEWIAKWKEDEYEDDYYGDIHDLAKAYLEKITPNDEYWGDTDTDYFNQQVGEHLAEIELTPAPKQEDPNQPELPLEGEPEAEGGTIQKPYSVHVGEPPNEKVYKGIPSGEATKYREAMKPTRDDITFRAESFLSIPLDRIEERQGDKKIEFEASPDAAASLVPLLKELKKMGNQGSSRDITIDDWDGRTNFGFDGDGNAKIGDIKVDGQVVEKLLENDEVDPKAIAAQAPHIEHFLVRGKFLHSQYPNTNYFYKEPHQWTPHAWDATPFAYEHAEATVAKLSQNHNGPGTLLQVVPQESDQDAARQESLAEAQQIDEAIYKLSTTQIDLPKDIAQHIISWGELNIADEDLYIDEKDGCGRETEQHVTVLYGLTDSTPSEELTKIVQSTKPFLIEFAGVSIFENPKYDVIKISVISEELHNLHSQIRKACPNQNKFPDYQPHCTIAYVLKGKGKKYAGQDVFKTAQVARDFWAYDLKFKGAGDSEDGNRVVDLISFDKSKDFEPDEPEAGEQRYPEATREEEPELAVAESAKEFLAAHAPVACPSCHSHNLSEEDEEGLVDCMDCGIWFDPLHPENQPVAESNDRDPERRWKGMTKQTDELAKTDPHAATVMAGGGTLIRPPLPSREKWNAMLAAYAPGCGSPTPYPGTGSKVPCGSTVEGKQFLCPYCEVPPVAESDEIDPKQFTERPGAVDPHPDWQVIDRKEDQHGRIKVLHRHKNGRVFFKLINQFFGEDTPKTSLNDWSVYVYGGAKGEDFMDGEDFEAGSYDEAETTATNIAFDITHSTAPSLFQPARPKRGRQQEAEEINAKEFLNRTTNYRVRMGVGAMTRYLSRDLGSGQLMWKDFDDASIFDTDEAAEMIDKIGDVYGGQPVVAELAESEIDPKAFIEKVPHHELQHWNEAGPEGGYKCSCGKWRYKLTGWSSSMSYAMKEFRAHKRLVAKQLAQESDVADPKGTAMRVPTDYVIKRYGEPASYWAGEGMLFYQNINDARLMSESEANAHYRQMVQANYSPNELGVIGVKRGIHRGKTNFTETLSGPFEDDGLPGEVTSFLRKVRSKRKTKAKRPII